MLSFSDDIASVPEVLILQQIHLRVTDICTMQKRNWTVQRHCNVEKQINLHLHCIHGQIITVLTGTPAASSTGKTDSSNAESKRHSIAGGWLLPSATLLCTQLTNTKHVQLDGHGSSGLYNHTSLIYPDMHCSKLFTNFYCNVSMMLWSPSSGKKSTEMTPVIVVYIQCRDQSGWHK